MEDNRTGQWKVWLPLLLSAIMALGMALGFSMRDTLRHKRSIQAIIHRNDRLEEIIDLINEKYVDTVNNNQLYQDAVQGILSHLDPHTVYIPAEQLQGVTEDLEGSFFGIGVEFAIIRDTIQVTSVIENGPSERAGIGVGDKFIKVGDSLIAGNGITSEGIVQMLRGKQHSAVNLLIRDALNGRYRNVQITRDVVPLLSIDASLMLDQQTGFIKINRFSATTYDEFMAALQKLKDRGMKQLILDLRQNPGGYLDAATSIADEFLDNDKLIVYTKGRRTDSTAYRASKPGLFEEGKLAILVDESSASASEVLAGAVQDWDRGVIVGRRTYGKGLVQEQFDLDDGSALRLTIAKYYTPSGRSIQRSFAQGREAYKDDLTQRFQNGELTGMDSAQVYADTLPFYTSRKRVVYGGGGIMPDVFVPYDTTRLSSGLLSMIFSEEMRNAIWDYFSANSSQLRAYKDVHAFEREFQDIKTVQELYLSALSPIDRRAAEYVLSRPANLNYFQHQARSQLARVLFRNNGYYAISTRQDPVVQKAIQLLLSGRYSQLIER